MNQRHCNIFLSDGVVTSETKGKDNTPLLTLQPVEGKGKKHKISVGSFLYVAKVLELAGAERKIDEVRACLEGMTNLYS